MFWIYACLWAGGFFVFLFWVFSKSKEGEEVFNCGQAFFAYMAASGVAIPFAMEKPYWPMLLFLVPVAILFGWPTVRIVLRKNKIDVMDRPPIP